MAIIKYENLKDHPDMNINYTFATSFFFFFNNNNKVTTRSNWNKQKKTPKMLVQFFLLLIFFFRVESNIYFEKKKNETVFCSKLSSNFVYQKTWQLSEKNSRGKKPTHRQTLGILDETHKATQNQSISKSHWSSQLQRSMIRNMKSSLNLS